MGHNIQRPGHKIRLLFEWKFSYCLCTLLHNPFLPHPKTPMNRIPGFWLLTLFLMPTLLAARTDTLHVSPTGNDRWSGRLALANISGTDGPIATLDAARTAGGKLARDYPAALDTVLVILHGGTYRLTRPLVITAADVPQAGSLVWRAAPGTTPRISGATTVTDFLPVTNAAERNRFSTGVRKSVLRADLKGQGIFEFGTIAPRGNAGIEIFFKGKRMDLARYPNQGWLNIADVPQSGDSLYNQGLEREKRYDGVPAGRHHGRITYTGNRPGAWAPVDDIIAHGYWTFDWSDTYQKINRVDNSRHEIIFAEPHHHYGYTKNQRFRFLNVMEELDTPGEWYIDRKAGVLFFAPPAPMNDGDVEASLMEAPLIALDECAQVVFDGIAFECTRGQFVSLRGGSRNSLTRCTFRNGASDAIEILGGTGHSVVGCEISDMARGAILVSGGDRTTLVPSGHIVHNTHIHHYGEWLRTGAYAVILDGVGHRLTHCLLHDAPFEAIYVKGNDHLIEYNEVHSVTKESGDAGALHTGRDYTWYGNVIRFNYFHDLKGPGLHGVMGVYLDDWATGFTVVGNVFYRAGRATLVGGGRDNIVKNNVYVECSPSIHLDARGRGWASYYFDGVHNTLFDRLKEVRGNQPPYTTRYPGLATLPGEDQDLPVNNRFENNLSYGGRWMDIYDFHAFDLHISTFRNNFSADPVVLRRWKSGQEGWDPYYLNIDLVDGYDALTRSDPSIKEIFKDDAFVPEPPFRFDAQQRVISVPPDSPARKAGFRDIPFSKMGLLR